MQKSVRFIVSVLILGAYLLSACSGIAPQSAQAPLKVQAKEVVFTGVVEATGVNQWTVSGQIVSVDTATMVDSNVKVGDIVRVEARVGQDGAVVALKIESSGADDANANSNSSNSNDNNANSNGNSNDNSNSNTNTNSNANSNDNGNGVSGAEQEFVGTVQAITTQSITINGVAYSLANFTEFKGAIAVGDQVKIHVIVNPDGTLTIREIEKTTGTAIGNNNSNGNSNSNDDNSNSGKGKNNSNDDDDDSNDNSNDNDD